MNWLPKISEAEWQVMKVLWKRSPQSAQEVIDALASSTHWSPATVKTLLNRLVKKKALQFERHGKAYFYSPACTEEACRAAEARSFLDRVFDGSLSPLLAHFVSQTPLTPAELEELEGILKKTGKQA
jgi:BlaI family penicillinase repressor